LTLKMGLILSYEMSVDFYQTMHYYNT
jgi:hypothetical protein